MMNRFVISMILCLSLTLKHICAQRKFAHSHEEMALADEVLIEVSGCQSHETIILLSSAAESVGKYHDRRMAIRQSWAPLAIANGLRPIFVLGRPSNPEHQLNIEEEAAQYEDILQFGFTDYYYNMTLKSFAELKWSSKHCNESRYVIQSDDDTWWNVPLLKQMLDQQKFPLDGLVGKEIYTSAVRDTASKWYQPESIYTATEYSQLLGIGIIYPGTLIPTIVNTMAKFSEPILDIDDLFITSVIADKINIPRYDSCRIDYSCITDECQLEMSLMVICDDMKSIHENWIKSEWNGRSVENLSPFDCIQC